LEKQMIESSEPCARCEQRLRIRQAVLDWAPLLLMVIDMVRPGS
jgi:hypothetical protein